jgi:hypothetical protein
MVCREAGQLAPGVSDRGYASVSSSQAWTPREAPTAHGEDMDVYTWTQWTYAVAQSDGYEDVKYNDWLDFLILLCPLSTLLSNICALFLFLLWFPVRWQWRCKIWPLAFLICLHLYLLCFQLAMRLFKVVRHWWWRKSLEARALCH